MLSTKARQGETAGIVRWVLGISLTLVIIGMVVAFLMF
jgi:F0F1-type ATP synthase membrane subunit c/vacuolar-type H+-ATPase subunit K